jgi:hypothetical protein
MKLKADSKNILNLRRGTNVCQISVGVQKDAHHATFTARFYEEGLPDLDITDRHISEDGLALFRATFLLDLALENASSYVR